MVIPDGFDTLPSVGVTNPQITFSRVDFQAPFFPTRPMRSRRFIIKPMFEKSSKPPKRMVMLSIDSIFSAAI